jgi:hypothetical protein
MLSRLLVRVGREAAGPQLEALLLNWSPRRVSLSLASPFARRGRVHKAAT